MQYICLYKEIALQNAVKLSEFDSKNLLQIFSQAKIYGVATTPLHWQINLCVQCVCTVCLSENSFTDRWIFDSCQHVFIRMFQFASFCTCFNSA